MTFEGHGRAGYHGIPDGLTGLQVLRYTPFRCLLNMMDKTSAKVSVIIPCRNERGTIAKIIERMPVDYSLVFVEGHSSDGTWQELCRCHKDYPARSVQVLRQQGHGKADAVIAGFQNAPGDVLAIFDGDMTIDPEALPDMIAQLDPGTLVVGVRLESTMERGAMRWLNVWANRFFAWWLSWICGQPIKDALCGTKILFKADWERMGYWPGDPFLDFTLIFEAARLGMRIVNVPVVYRARQYGHTQIRRFYHGWLLLKMSLLATWRLRIARRIRPDKV